MAQYLSLPRIEESIWLTPEEITTIEALISEAQEQLTTLENQVNKDGAGDSEQSPKDLKIVEIASLQNILAPIRRMPLEIISKIFMAYCSMDHNMHQWRGGLNQGTCTRTTLTSVCAAWRNAAHATPELWSELKIHREGYQLHSSADSDIVTQWLSRSGDLPLDLNISLRMGYMGNISKAFPAFSHRIRSLEVCLPMEQFKPFIHLPKSSFPSLEKLILEFRHRDPFHFSEIQYPNGIEIFSNSRQLNYVEFTEDGSSSLLENIKFPRDAVTSLVVVAYSCYRSQFPGIYFDTVRSMSKLVYCTIEFPRQRFGISDTLQPVILPFLQSLTLTMGWGIDTGYDVIFFRCLCAPLLKDLHLRNKSENYAALVEQLAGFCERSAVSLSSLHLSSFFGDAISGEDIIPLVAVFPSIRTLRIDETGMDMDARPLMNALVYNPAHPGPLHLPNLEELYLDGYKVGEEEVCNLIQSHWRLINEDNTGVNQSLPDLENGTSRLRKARIRVYRRGHYNAPFERLKRESALHGIQFDFC